MDRRRVLFVCLGNICRSPLAEGVLRKMVDERGLGAQVDIDSAGTGGWHQGEAPDSRAIATGLAHGVDISGLRGRKVTSSDFNKFDLIFAMDRGNLRDLVKIAPHDSYADIHLFMDFVSGQSRDVPDPYYGSLQDFEAVYALLQSGCDTLIEILFKP
jgi:protein-tyrosine phosphatase